MKCYLINLDRAQERLARMETLLGNLGLPFERVAAIDGKALSIDEMQALGLSKTIDRTLRPTEYACALSHYKCIEAIAEGDDAYALVLEDDVHFSAAARRFLTAADWIPQDADIVKIETYLQRVRLRAGPRLDRKHRLFRLLSLHYGCAAYIVSREAARKIRRFPNFFDWPADHTFFNPEAGLFPQLVVYQMSPAIAIQDDMNTQTHRDMLVSQIDHISYFEGANRKRRGLAKAWREFARLFERAGRLCRWIVLREKFVEVKYKP